MNHPLPSDLPRHLRKPSALRSAVWSLLALPLLASAQDAGPAQGDTPSQQPSSVQRIEISARQSATDLRRAASVAKQIYDREELDKYGDTNVLDVLKRLPGVNVAGGAPRMRGLGAGYTQILINGDPAPAGFSLDQLSPSQVERIEVLRAPTAENSAQAIAGTINIILKEAPRRSQRDLRLGLTDGAQRPMGNANVTLGESKGGLSASLPLSLFEWNRDNELDIERHMPGSDGRPSASLQHGDMRTWGWGYNLGPRVNWKISDEQSLSVQGFINKAHWNNRSAYSSQVLSGQPLLDDDSAQHGSWGNRRANFTWTNRFSADQRIEIKAGAQQSRWTFDSTSLRAGLEYVHTVGEGRDDGYTQAGKYSLLLGQSHSVTAGWDLETRKRVEQRSSTRYGVALLPEYEGQPFDAHVRRSAFYAQDEWEISPQWQLYLGLRQEQIRTESRATDAPVLNTSRVLSPLAHLSYKFDPKGRDMIRASLTRSYKAAPIGLMLARPSLSGSYLDTHAGNTELSPDRIGNPSLKPELATGLDLAYEHYLPGSGIISVGLFHRRVSGLVRSVTTLQSVPWATVPRWVSQPQNFSDASSSGLELEIKGQASDLLPSLLPTARTLSLRASLSLYRSRVAALPGPDNRLDGQQPWQATLGFDHRFTSLPLVVGANLAFTPAYDTQLTLDQVQQRSHSRNLDAYALWTLRPGAALRLAASAGAQPFGPSSGTTTTLLANGDYARVTRDTKPLLSLTLDLKL